MIKTQLDIPQIPVTLVSNTRFEDAATYRMDSGVNLRGIIMKSEDDMKFALIAAIALSVLMAFFALQNSQPAQVTFLGWYFSGSLVIILLMSFGTGVLAAFLAMLPGSLRKSMEISKLKSRVLEYSSKLKELERSQDDVTPSKKVTYEQRVKLP